MRQALLIVDVQPCFAPPDWLLEGIGQLLGRMPSVASVERHDESRTPFQRQLGWRPPLDDACLVAADRVFVKHGYLPTAELVDHLRALRAERVLVCGIQADTCVLAAGFALFDAGLQPTLIGDLVLGSSLDRSGSWVCACGSIISARSSAWPRCWRIEAQWGRLSSATVASAFIIRAAASGVSPAASWASRRAPWASRLAATSAWLNMAAIISAVLPSAEAPRRRRRRRGAVRPSPGRP